MAYTKTVWNNNTPPDISAENLNKMEQGIADAQFPNGGSTGQVLTKTASGQAWDDVDGLPNGGTAGQVLTKNSSTDGDASWQNASGGGNVDTVNGISPDANKNVQTATDLTEAAYEALPSTKESDNVDYYLTDADSTVATAEDIPYDNTTSGMTATNVQGALDELTTGLTYQLSTSFVGNQSVNLPAVFHELYIIASVQIGGNSYNRTMYLIKNVLSDTYQYFYSGDSGGRISTHISKTAIDAIEYYDGSTDCTVNTTFAIYYR